MAMHEHGGAAVPSAHEAHDMGGMTQHAGAMIHDAGAKTHDTSAMAHDMGAMAHGAHAQPLAPPPSAALIAPPGAPTAALSPDPVDAPALTSVADARRAAEAGIEMGGMAGLHGTSGYRQQDPGRAPGSAPPQPTPPAHSHATPPPGGRGTDE